jgi:hypothetical protein
VPDNKGLFCCVYPLHNDRMKYGYARVSPGGKSESVDAQARQLTKAGCGKVFRDVHVSGAKKRLRAAPDAARKAA